MTQTATAQTIHQQAKRGEALLEQNIGQQRATNAQFYAAMFVLLFACGLALGAIAEVPAETLAHEHALSAEDDKNDLVKSSRFCIFGVDDLKLRPSAARGVDEKRSPAHFENGDCWIDKPGQMA